VTTEPQLKHKETEYEDINAFLIEIEKKAYRMVLLSVGQHADAIDILQDSMIKLVQKYADKPPSQWKPLFYRIVSNKITDWHRHQKLKSMLFFWKSDSESESLDNDLIDENRPLLVPEDELSKKQQQASMLRELAALSEKQRQCFLLRSWEGLSVAETAEVMECSQGSVKTHYFRAVNKLRAVIGDIHHVTI
jgi:RNA polymerase sigma-70 factor (ECF subfamily)